MIMIMIIDGRSRWDNFPHLHKSLTYVESAIRSTCSILPARLKEKKNVTPEILIIQSRATLSAYSNDEDSDNR